MYQKNSLCLPLLGEQWRVFRGEDVPRENGVGINFGILIPPGGTRARIYRPNNLQRRNSWDSVILWLRKLRFLTKQATVIWLQKLWFLTAQVVVTLAA